MADDYNIKTFTAADIERYHNGQLSAKEMHAMEKAALDDPFLADAMEGYAVSGVNVSADIAELKKRLAGKKEETKVIPIYGAGGSSFPWLRAAVAIVLIAGAGLLSYQFLFRSDSNEIAQVPSKKDSPAKPIETVGTQPGIGSSDSSSTASVPANGLNSQPGSNKVDAVVSDKVDVVVSNPGTFSIEKQKPDEIPDVPKGDLASVPEGRNVPAVVTAPPKAEFKASNEVKALRNDNAYDKSSVADRNDDAKSKELESAKKTEANADGVAGRADVAAFGKEVANKKVASQQGMLYRQNSAPNIFRGRITDANNNALPFANVTNTVDNVGTYTDAKGNFALISPDSVMDVQVRSLGFENNKIRLRSSINTNQVTLHEDRSLTEKVLDTAKRNYARVRDGNLTFEEPEPADGWMAYDSYLFNNRNDIPEAYTVKKNTGSDAVELSFEVNKNGDPVNIKVEKSLCDKCDKEAIRLLKEGPKWKRKAKKGKRTTVTVPFIKTD